MPRDFQRDFIAFSFDPSHFLLRGRNWVFGFAELTLSVFQNLTGGISFPLGCILLIRKRINFIR